MILLIDDIRSIECDCIARNPSAAYKLLALGGWTEVIFDHDLGNCESGYTVLCWAINNGFLPDKVTLVTANIVGRENMSAALRASGYQSKNGYDFVRNEGDSS